MLVSSLNCCSVLIKWIAQLRALLTLLLSSFSLELQITLRTERLTIDHIPRSEALSYVWGSTENPSSLIVQTSTGRKVIAITQNLAQALQYLRREDKDRVLWIDAICVNQADLIERGGQVNRMADVYELASRVVVWLGEEKDSSVVDDRYPAKKWFSSDKRNIERTLEDPRLTPVALIERGVPEDL